MSPAKNGGRDPSSSLLLYDSKYPHRRIAARGEARSRRSPSTGRGEVPRRDRFGQVFERDRAVELHQGNPTEIETRGMPTPIGTGKYPEPRPTYPPHFGPQG